MSRSNLSPIEKAVKRSADFIFTDSAPLFVVAVSGGVDSMCLLHSLYRLNISGIVAHVNYQKRGAASEKDAALVAQKAEEWAFDCEILEADPEEAQGQNFQQWARDIRYRFFRDLITKHNADGIALAHHKDDQVETILQKLLRGSGMSSWSGMDVWDGELFRPLLSISREQIEQYAEKNEIPYRTDESNLESHFARNFLRNEWTEKLSEFFPGWDDNVLQIADKAENYRSALQWIAGQIVDQKKINKRAFDKLEPGLQRALVLHLLKNDNPGMYVTQQNLERVKELPDLQTGKAIQISSDYSIIRDRDFYIIKEKGGQSFEAQKVSRDELNGAPINVGEVELAVEPYTSPDFEEGLYLDVDKINWPVTVRKWETGDRFQPLGMSGHQTVADHLTNRKVSAAHKEDVLAIESFEETICALIFPPIKNQSSPGTISELVKCDNSTKYCLRIKY
jgi:tRNA(Ile)-lysidine synthase